MSDNKVIYLKSDNFSNFINESEVPVLVDFWAPWCGPCRMIGPVIDELADDYEGKVNVCKLNVDEEMDIAMEYKVMTIPTIILFKEGKVVKQSIGVASKKELENMIEEFI